MENHMLGSVDGLEGLFDEVLPGLDQHLDGHIVGDVPSLNEGADESVFRLRGGGEAHLNLLDADVHQGVEELQLFFHVHGVNQGLVAVPQVHGAPDRGRFQLPVGPGAAGQADGDKGNVLFMCGLHGDSSYWLGPERKNAPDPNLVRGV